MKAFTRSVSVPVLALLILMIGVLAAVILLTVVGAVLLWIPILVLLVAAGALYRLLRR